MDTKKKMREHNQKYYKEHKEQIKAHQREYNRTHKDQIKAYREDTKESIKEYQKEYEESYKARRCELRKKGSEELSDSYIKQLLRMFGIDNKFISSKVIDLKRRQIIFYRKSNNIIKREKSN